MSAYQDKKGQWFLVLRYKDWTGKHLDNQARVQEQAGEALAWEQSFVLRCTRNLALTLLEFYGLYHENMQTRLRMNTWLTKGNIIENKILPYFGDMRM